MGEHTPDWLRELIEDAAKGVAGWGSAPHNYERTRWLTFWETRLAALKDAASALSKASGRAPTNKEE